MLHNQRKLWSAIYTQQTARAMYRSLATNATPLLKKNDHSLPAKPVKEHVLEHKFIPMTRRTLIRKLMEHSHLIGKEEYEKYLNFTVGLERSLSRKFHGVLSELKVN